MATVTTSILSNDLVGMIHEQFVLFDSGLTATDTVFSWQTSSTQASTVALHGSNLAYAGSGDDRELQSGTVSSLSIDLTGDNGSTTQGDLVVTGISGANAANIDKGSLQGLWGEILKGDDVFNLIGFGVDEVGLGSTAAFFGDDYQSPASIQLSEDTGGSDVMLGAENKITLVGDVWSVKGGESGDTFITSTYNGGDDTIVAAQSVFQADFIGDAFTVLTDGILNGGDDTIDASGNISQQPLNSGVAGDAYFVRSFAAVNGGNDIITPNYDGNNAGDVFFLLGSNSFVTGGDDRMIAADAGLATGAGDIYAMDQASANCTITCGDDRLVASANGTVASGDVYVSQTGANTVIAGDDVLIGGAGSDKLYGELAFGSLAGFSGGDDRLQGNGGNDKLFGQTGDDVLHGGGFADRLFGGTGNDRLFGEGSADRFVFVGNAGADRILDFTDKNGASDDVLDFTRYEFTSLGQISKVASGDDLILKFGKNEQVTIVDYLASHAINAINDDIRI